MQYKTLTGIVLKHLPLREADEVITFWSWEEGKIRLLARSVRKSESRLKGALSPLSWLELEVVPSEYLPVIVGARVVRSYRFFESKLSHLACVFNIFEMVMQTTADREANHQITMLLRWALDYLETRTSIDLDFLNSFRVQFMQALGYEFQLRNCVQCRKQIGSEDLYFSYLASGLVCNRCQKVFFDSVRTTAEVRNYLEKLRIEKNPAGRQNVRIGVQKDAEALLSNFYGFLTERTLNSEPFLKENIKID